MTHNSKCERAKIPVEQCTCDCNGAYHGIKTSNSDRKDLVGQKEGKCLKCGDTIFLVEKWKYYYCNSYCCNPCCPDSAKVPCTKEIVERMPDDDIRRQLLVEKMRKHVHLKRSFQKDINSEWVS